MGGQAMRRTPFNGRQSFLPSSPCQKCQFAGRLAHFSGIIPVMGVIVAEEHLLFDKILHARGREALRAAYGAQKAMSDLTT